MNVLLVPSSFTPNVGGVEQVTHNLALGLRSRHCDVSVLTSRWPLALRSFETIDDIPVRRMNFLMPSRRLRDTLAFFRGFRASARTAQEAVTASRADVVHVHCFGPNLLYAAWASMVLQRPLILSTHGELQGDDTGMRRSCFMRMVRRWAVSRASWITACSNFTLARAGAPLAARTRVIYNAVSLPSYGAAVTAPATRYIFSAARLTPNKGIDLLLRAFAAVHDQLGATQLWIAGEGGEGERLRGLSAELGLGDRVRFLGAKSTAEIRELMSGCLFYVCSSRNEGFGLAALEAMAMGKPVSAFRVGGLPEVVKDCETGLLVEAEDVIGLGNALVRLASDASLTRRLGGAARERAKEFSLSRMVNQYMELYENVCPTGGRQYVLP